MVQIKHIKEILLKGFQSHIDSSIGLVPGLNVVTGASDSGKTAIIRSIRWALYSEPTGDAFINPEVGKAQVTLNFSDGSDITRSRGKTENCYSANGQDFKGFGTNVPLEVTEAHGMNKVKFGEMETSLNISFQLDAPFMLSETAGAAAKVLGKLAGTEELDLAAKDVNSDLFKARQEKSSLEHSIEKTETTLTDYVWVEDAEIKLLHLEVLMNELEEKNERDLQLVKLADKQSDLILAFAAAEGHIKKFMKVESLQELVRWLELSSDKYSRLQTLVQKASTIREDCIDNLLIIKGLKKLPKLIELYEVMCGLSEKLPKLVTLDRKDLDINKSSWIQKSIITKVKNLDTAVKFLSGAIDKYMRVSDFNKCKTKAEYLAGRIEGGGKYLKKFENLQKVEQILLGTNAKLIVLDELEDCNNKFSDKSIKIRNSKVEIATNTGYEETSKELFTDYLKELGKCPTCHTDIEDIQIKSIIGGS